MYELLKLRASQWWLKQLEAGLMIKIYSFGLKKKDLAIEIGDLDLDEHSTLKID